MTYIHVKMKLRNCVDFLLQMYNVQHEEGLQLQQTTVVHVISFHLNAQSVIFFISCPTTNHTPGPISTYVDESTPGANL